MGLKFKKVFTFNFFELLPVGHFAFICQRFMIAKSFLFVFGEPFRNFFPGTCRWGK